MKKSFCLFVLVGCLLTPLAAQTIKVDSPNGGEPMVLGDKWQIKWTATNVSGNVKIQLIKPGGAIIGVIAPNLAPGGSPFPWTVGQTNNGTAAAGDYKIRVMALDGSASDGSDKAFTITEAGPVPPPPPPSGDPTLQLTSFNDGGIFPLGMPQNITGTPIGAER